LRGRWRGSELGFALSVGIGFTPRALVICHALGTIGRVAVTGRRQISTARDGSIGAADALTALDHGVLVVAGARHLRIALVQSVLHIRLHWFRFDAATIDDV